MDPTAALNRLIDAAIAGDYDEMIEAAQDLSRWLATGGFAPQDPRT